MKLTDYELKVIGKAYDVEVVGQNEHSITIEKYNITRDSYSYHQIDKEQAILKAKLGYEVSDRAKILCKKEQLRNEYYNACKQAEYYQNRAKTIKEELDSISND